MPIVKSFPNGTAIRKSVKMSYVTWQLRRALRAMNMSNNQVTATSQDLGAGLSIDGLGGAASEIIENFSQSKFDCSFNFRFGGEDRVQIFDRKYRSVWDGRILLRPHSIYKCDDIIIPSN